MRNIIRKIAHKLRFVTWYHVSATYSIPNGTATISMTCSVRPWLHADNYNELVEYVGTQASTKNAKPSIVSLTKLGI